MKQTIFCVRTPKAAMLIVNGSCRGFGLGSRGAAASPARCGSSPQCRPRGSSTISAALKVRNLSTRDRRDPGEVAYLAMPAPTSQEPASKDMEYPGPSIRYDHPHEIDSLSLSGRNALRREGLRGAYNEWGALRVNAGRPRAAVIAARYPDAESGLRGR